MNSDIQRVMKVKPVTQTIAKVLLMLLGVIVTLIINANSSYAPTTEDIDKNATQALNHLYAKNKVANEFKTSEGCISVSKYHKSRLSFRWQLW